MCAKTLIIIPAFNEEESLPSTMEQLSLHAGGVDYLIVNDGSLDGTEALCEKNGYTYASLPANLGLTGAFKTGMMYAHRNGYDYAIQFDADGQHDAQSIHALIEKAESSHADIVVGSRFVERKKPVSARMAGSVLISALLRLTTRTVLRDPTSGMRLYSARVIALFAKGFDYSPEPETLAVLFRYGYTLSEVQVNMHERVAGESYLTFTSSLSYMFRACMSLLFVQWFRSCK